MKEQYKFLLDEKDIPKQWYNIVPDLPKSYPSKDFDNLIPATVTFDTLVLSKTGPLVSEWKEITTVNLG